MDKRAGTGFMPRKLIAAPTGIVIHASIRGVAFKEF